MPALPNSAIGVFDSGVGGLSVLREIRRALPLEDLIYVADSGYAPYGDRPAAYIESRVFAIADFLLGQKVKALVVACNTASGVAREALRAYCQVPVVAMEPAIKPASVHTRTGVIGVLATSQTLASESVSRLVAAHGKDIRVLLQACPGLVEQVESGALNAPHTRALLHRYLDPLLDQGADTLVMGCTHYPFLRDAIADIAGPGVTLIDPAPAIARQLHRKLHAAGLLRTPTSGQNGAGKDRFWTSGALPAAATLMPTLWGRPAQVLRLPSGA